VILNYSVFTNFVYTSPLISDIIAVNHRIVMIIMLGDNLIFQQNIVCTFLRRWGQIWTYHSKKEQLDSNLDCTLCLTLLCRFFFGGGGSCIFSPWPNLQIHACRDWGDSTDRLRVSIGDSNRSRHSNSPALRGKKNLQHFVCWPSTGWHKKKLAGNHVRLVILLVPMFSATIFRSFVCFCITDGLVSFPLVQAPLKREFNLNGNQTEFQHHSKHSTYTGMTDPLMLFGETISDFSNEPNGT